MAEAKKKKPKKTSTNKKAKKSLSLVLNNLSTKKSTSQNKDDDLTRIVPEHLESKFEIFAAAKTVKDSAEQKMKECSAAFMDYIMLDFAKDWIAAGKHPSNPLWKTSNSSMKVLFQKYAIPNQSKIESLKEDFNIDVEKYVAIKGLSIDLDKIAASEVYSEALEEFLSKIDDPDIITKTEKIDPLLFDELPTICKNNPEILKETMKTLGMRILKTAVKHKGDEKDMFDMIKDEK